MIMLYVMLLPGERDVKRLYILAKSEDERDHWLGQLSKITLVRDNRPSSPSAKEKLSIGRQKSQRRPSSASTKDKALTMRDRSINPINLSNPQRSASVRGHGRLDQIRSSDFDLTGMLVWDNPVSRDQPLPFLCRFLLQFTMTWLHGRGPQSCLQTLPHHYTTLSVIIHMNYWLITVCKLLYQWLWY